MVRAHSNIVAVSEAPTDSAPGDIQAAHSSYTGMA